MPLRSLGLFGALVNSPEGMSVWPLICGLTLSLPPSSLRARLGPLSRPPSGAGVFVLFVLLLLLLLLTIIVGLLITMFGWFTKIGARSRYEPEWCVKGE